MSFNKIESCITQACNFVIDRGLNELTIDDLLAANYVLIQSTLSYDKRLFLFNYFLKFHAHNISEEFIRVATVETENFDGERIKKIIEYTKNIVFRNEERIENFDFYISLFLEIIKKARVVSGSFEEEYFDRKVTHYTMDKLTRVLPNQEMREILLKYFVISNGLKVSDGFITRFSSDTNGLTGFSLHLIAKKVYKKLVKTGNLENVTMTENYFYREKDRQLYQNWNRQQSCELV